MVERKICVDGLKLSYEGIFEAEELYAIIDAWERDKAYTKHELENTEQVIKTGKHVFFVMEPYRKISDYAKYIIRIEIEMENVKDVLVEREGKKVKMQQGKVTVTLYGFFETDYEKRWHMKPVYYFLSAVFDRYFYSSHVKRQQEGLVEEVHQVYSLVHSFLNLYKYKFTSGAV